MRIDPQLRLAAGALALLLAAGVLAAAPRAARAVPADATSTCWRAVIADWANDGAIEGAYPLGCYRAAMANAPTDLRIYSDLEDELRHALQTRAGRQLAVVPRRTLALATASSDTSSLPVVVGVLGGLGIAVTMSIVVAAFLRRRGASPPAS